MNYTHTHTHTRQKKNKKQREQKVVRSTGGRSLKEYMPKSFIFLPWNICIETEIHENNFSDSSKYDQSILNCLQFCVIFFLSWHWLPLIISINKNDNTDSIFMCSFMLIVRFHRQQQLTPFNGTKSLAKSMHTKTDTRTQTHMY